MHRIFQLIVKKVKSQAFRKASARAEELKQKLKKANKFTTPAIAAEASEFFTRLEKKSPDIRRMLRVQENEISSLIIEKKTGFMVILD